eukprot:GHVS01048946.1.p1 GENE.GHVS01048946.1~~GHVS01048946.1.p1  ORF type:complete len:289 (+),score=102.08 GHVS01048946.1:333-1199(+)
MSPTENQTTTTKAEVVVSENVIAESGKVEEKEGQENNKEETTTTTTTKEGECAAATTKEADECKQTSQQANGVECKIGGTCSSGDVGIASSTTTTTGTTTAAPAVGEKAASAPVGVGGIVVGGGVVPPAPKEEDNNYYPEEEVTEGDWRTPSVEVNLVKIETGEEEEEVFWSHRSKLFRWDGESSAWKERGIGEAKLLKHKNTGKIRFLLRQEKTLKVMANHYVHAKDAFCKLTLNVASDKIWVWTTPDSAEDESTVEQFGLKFGQLEQATIFKQKFEEAAEVNDPLF